MAKTEIQITAASKQTFYNNLQSTANKIAQLMEKVKYIGGFIDDVDMTDLNTMGVATGQVRTDLGDFRNVLAELNAYWDNEQVNPVKDPQAIIDKIRSMNII